jgi:hypothetical protein
VVLRVFFQIAVGTGFGDGIDDARPIHGFQLLHLGAQLLRALGS